jgi:type IV pilus assembly protein PilY1
MKTSHKLILSVAGLCQIAWLCAHAAPPGPLTLAQSPLFLGVQNKPIVMLNLTKDNQLHFKAYTDYSDLDDDGIPELTYKHSFNYYGYWDSQKCYDYIPLDGGYFAPTATGYSGDKFCGGISWSGNFLNWVATSRMDSVRKILYGGKRSTDTATDTVLERNFLTMDAHSWAKFYDGADLNKLVPATILGTLNSSSTAVGTTYTNNGGATVTATAIDATGNYFIRPIGAFSARVGDQIKLTQGIADVIRYARVTAITGAVLTINVPNATVGVVGTIGATASTSSWNLENMSARGVTFCNTTFVGNGSSNTAVAPPLIRMALGNTELWAANERWQCGFLGEKANNSGGGFTASGQNGNYFPLSGLKSNAESPPNNTTYKVADYTARVKACVDQSSVSDPQDVWAKREGCKAYGAQWKPVGFLQKQDGFKFGLFTGSYAKNISGGVLRSNAGDFSLEVDSNGRFIDPSASTALTAKGSIVKAINSIRMSGYNYGDGTYQGFDGDCTFQLIDLVPTGASGNKRNQGACSSWGNPVAEMYTESLRYLAGAAADPNYTYTSAGSTDAALGLSIIQWQDPIDANNYCVPLKNIIFNAATTSYDGDQVNMTGLAGASSAASYTDVLGGLEGITGGIVGKINGAAATSAAFNSCTDKTGALSTLRGVCPEGAPYSGSYLTAGSAFYARNNRIRTNPPIPANAATLFPSAYTVETFGVSLANNTPKIELLTQDGKAILATITPAYRLVKADGVGGGTIVDFKIIKAPDFSQNIVSGVYYVNWEDSGFGGDFDQDVIGRIEFSFNRGTGVLSVTTAATNASTANPQGFGYVLSGSNIDGPHFHSGILTFNYTNPVSGAVECTNCQAGQAPTTQNYTLTGIAGTSLKDLLYYAAKWGAITNPGSAAIALFDKKGKRNVTTGVDGPDGIPDNYFNVSNPAKLAEQLESLFTGLGTGSSASSAAASTSRGSSDTLIFTASFVSKTWGGSLKASSLVLSGATATFPVQWDAADVLNAQAATDRKLYTTRTDTRVGVPFEWGSLSPAQQTALVSEDLQKYIAGFRTNEGTLATNFRARAPSVLGDIVNSNPAYSPENTANSSGFSTFPGYAAFAKQFDTRLGQLGTARTKTVFVGANDGIFHAFNGEFTTTAGGGKEIFGYVPSMIHANLPAVANQNYTVIGNHKYFVDGSPIVSEANAGTAATPDWKTVVISGLGAGGAGYFALDVTRPENFNASKVLWELTAADVTRNVSGVTKSDLGASTTQARITRTKTSATEESWFAVFGNGYNSTTTPTHGQAVLVVARLGKTSGPWSTADLAQVVLSTELDNGLSTPTLVDVDDDGFVDLIYAGDLQGNLWRIDARNADPKTWTGKRLFTAPKTVVSATISLPQSITAAPKVTRHPSGGLMILFGTGKYLELSDTGTIPPVQALYGIRDVNPTSTTVTTQTTVNPISIIKATTGDRSLPLDTDAQCNNALSWGINLTNGGAIEGERNIFEGTLFAGSLLVSTLTPSSDICVGGGQSSAYCINPFTGCACSAEGALINTDKGVTPPTLPLPLPQTAIGLNSSSGGGQAIGTRQRYLIPGNSDGNATAPKGVQSIPTTSGRMTWREIVGQ